MLMLVFVPMVEALETLLDAPVLESYFATLLLLVLIFKGGLPWNITLYSLHLLKHASRAGTQINFLLHRGSQRTWLVIARHFLLL
jgi:hypothetical protein